MNKLHLAISTNKLDETVKDYSQRLGQAPAVVVPNEYALWRTETLNVSIRVDENCSPGQLRHLGWEDNNATTFTEEKDVNGIVWERFSAAQQAEEINALWPDAQYQPE